MFLVPCPSKGTELYKLVLNIFINNSSTKCCTDLVVFAAFRTLAEDKATAEAACMPINSLPIRPAEVVC